MEFNIRNIYDKWDESLSGKKVIYSNDLQFIKDSCSSRSLLSVRLLPVFKGDDTAPFKDSDGCYHYFVYYDPDFDTDEYELHEVLANTLLKLSNEDSAEAMVKAMLQLQNTKVQEIVSRLISDDVIVDALTACNWISTDNTDEMLYVIKNDAKLSEDVYMNYKDEYMSMPEKSELVKELINELL